MCEYNRKSRITLPNVVGCCIREDGMEDNVAVPRAQRSVQAGRLRTSHGDVRCSLRARRYGSRPVHCRLPSSQGSHLDSSQDASTCRCSLARITHLRSPTAVSLR